MWNGTAGSHSKRTLMAMRLSCGSERSCRKLPAEKMNETKTLPTQRALMTVCASFRPKNSMAAAVMSGNIGISQMCARKNGSCDVIGRFSPFQHVHFVREDRLAIAEKRQNNAQANGSFSRSIRDNEDGENLAINGPKVPRERHEVDVDCVEDQLDGHEDDNHVAAREYADHADGEKREAQDQIGFGRDHGWPICNIGDNLRAENCSLFIRDRKSTRLNSSHMSISY